MSTEAEQLRKLSNIINESSDRLIVHLPHCNNTRSVRLNKIDPVLAAELMSNPRTKGTFYFSDGGDSMWQWGGTGQFIEMAEDAASEYCRRVGSKFARLALFKADLSITTVKPGTRDYY